MDGVSEGWLDTVGNIVGDQVVVGAQVTVGAQVIVGAQVTVGAQVAVGAQVRVGVNVLVGTAVGVGIGPSRSRRSAGTSPGITAITVGGITGVGMGAYLSMLASDRRKEIWRKSVASQRERLGFRTICE